MHESQSRQADASRHRRVETMSEDKCAEAWRRLFKAADSMQRRSRVCRKRRYFPRREGASLWAFREGHEVEHVAMMDYVGKKPYGGAVKV